MIGLIICGCGLAMYAMTDTEGRWTFVCEECDPNLAGPIASDVREVTP